MSESTLSLPATPEDVMRGVEHVQQFCQEHQVPARVVHAVMLAVEEMASNIVNHAYQRDASRQFQLTARHGEGQVVIELRDTGPAFDPLAAAAPDLESDPDERDIGGLGIHLVRHQMDELTYSREAGENVLRMTKRFTAA